MNSIDCVFYDDEAKNASNSTSLGSFDAAYVKNGDLNTARLQLDETAKSLSDFIHMCENCDKSVSGCPIYRQRLLSQKAISIYSKIPTI